MNAIQMAKQALEEQRRPQREAEEAAAARKAAEAKREEAKAKRRARALLKRSPLGEWFPGVDWKLLALDPAGPVFAPVENPDELRLLLRWQEAGQAVEVRFATHEAIRDHSDGRSYPVKLIHPYGDVDRYRTTVWWGPRVRSLIEVGKEVERHEESIRRFWDNYEGEKWS